MTPSIPTLHTLRTALPVPEPKADNGKCSIDHGTAATKATQTADHKAPSQDQEQDRDLFGDDDGDMYAGIDAGDVKDEEYNLAGPIDQVSCPRCILVDILSIFYCGNTVSSSTYRSCVTGSV